MTDAAVFLVVSICVLTALGLGVLAPLRAMHRAALLPLAPLLGAALLASVASWASFVVPAVGGLVLAGLVAATLFGVAVLRGRRPWDLPRGAVVQASALLALGLVPAVVASIPSLWTGDARAVSPNASHDIFYYVASATWLAENPVSPVPALGEVPGTGTMVPADSPIRSSLTIPVRIGQPLVHGALSVASGVGPGDSAMALVALWVLLVTPAGFVAGRLLRLGRLASTALAVTGGMSALLLHQAYQQNVDSLLGAAVALPAVAACAATLARRVPAWPAVVLLAGLAAVYVEILLFVVPAVAGAVLLSAPARAVGSRLVRIATVVVPAVALAGPAWVRGLQAALVDRSADHQPSQLTGDGWVPAVLRVVGVTPLGLPSTMTRPGLVLAAFLVAGLLLAVTVARHRAMWWPMLAVGAWSIGSATLAGQGYVQVRTAVLFAPFLALAAVDGWAAGTARLRRAAIVPPWAPRVVTACLALAVLAFAALNLRAAPQVLERDAVLARHLGPAYDEVDRWVGEYGGTDGEAVTVLVPDYVSVLWVAYTLRDEPLVSYPALWPDYLGRRDYWAGEADRYLVVGPGAVLAAGPTAVVERNARFSLVDQEAGPVVAGVTAADPAQWGVHADPEGHLSGFDMATLTLLRSATGPSKVALEVSGLPRLTTVAVSVDGGPPTQQVVDGAGEVLLDLADRRSAVVLLDTGGDGAPGGPMFVLEGVRGVG